MTDSPQCRPDLLADFALGSFRQFAGSLAASLAAVFLPLLRIELLQLLNASAKQSKPGRMTYRAATQPLPSGRRVTSIL